MGTTRKIPTPLRQRLKRARVGALPLLVWFAAVLCASKLWLAGPRTSTYYGLAQALEINVSIPVDGELDSILVELYQSVSAGQALATIDAAGLEARLATARAELERLAATLEAERAILAVADKQARSVASLEYPAESRAFHSDEAGIELNILETRLAITVSEMEANRVEVRLRRAEALVEGAIGPRVDVQDLEKRHSEELARSQGLRLVEAGLEASLARARDRRTALEASYEAPPSQTMPKPALEARLAGWSAAMVVQRKRMDELELLRDAHVLRAPAAGRVAALIASQGQFLLAGDPVLVLIDPQVRDVALWVPESAPVPARIGDRFLVARTAAPRPGTVVEGVVQALSPRMELMPQRLWRDARVPEYGRVGRLGPAGALDLVPGERVRIDPAHGPRPD